MLVIPLHMLLTPLLGWLDREQRDVIAFLCEENRLLRRNGVAPAAINDGQRRRLVILGQRLGRAVLREVGTIVTPDIILRCTANGNGPTHDSSGLADLPCSPRFGILWFE